MYLFSCSRNLKQQIFYQIIRFLSFMLLFVFWFRPFILIFNIGLSYFLIVVHTLRFCKFDVWICFHYSFNLDVGQGIINYLYLWLKSLKVCRTYIIEISVHVDCMKHVLGRTGSKLRYLKPLSACCALLGVVMEYQYWNFEIYLFPTKTKFLSEKLNEGIQIDTCAKVMMIMQVTIQTNEVWWSSWCTFARHAITLLSCHQSTTSFAPKQLSYTMIFLILSEQFLIDPSLIYIAHKLVTFHLSLL